MAAAGGGGAGAVADRVGGRGRRAGKAAPARREEVQVGGAQVAMAIQVLVGART